MGAGYWVIIIGIGAVSWLVQWNLKRKFAKYSQIPLSNGMTGKDVSELMLRENGITDVTVQAVGGMLTDHYNPADKTINLSEDVYSTCSVAAAAVAAHETGHALQHAQAYAPLKLRSALVTAVSFSSKWVTWLLLGGMVLMGDGSRFGYPVLAVAVGLFGLTTLFSLITLPVEINASQRALAWLSRSGITNSSNDAEARDALKSAAYTYVVAAIGSLVTFLYYLAILMGGRRN
jgi:Zn-dependent membrane protease YugP